VRAAYESFRKIRKANLLRLYIFVFLSGSHGALMIRVTAFFT
jgi:hypothetical protein